MLESSYNILFGKLALKCLFEDYFEEASHFTTRIMLKPIDDPHVDFIATVSIPHCSSSLFYNFLLSKLCYFTIRHAIYDLGPIWGCFCITNFEVFVFWIILMD